MCKPGYRLRMGAPGYVNHLLYQRRKAVRREHANIKSPFTIFCFWETRKKNAPFPHFAVFAV